MKTVAEVRTYNKYDATSTGYDVEIREDASLRVRSRSRWQGSRTDEVWVLPPQPTIAAALATEDPDQPDVETAVRTLLLETDWQSEARRVRSGYLVQ